MKGWICFSKKEKHPVFEKMNMGVEGGERGKGFRVKRKGQARVDILPLDPSGL